MNFPFTHEEFFEVIRMYNLGLFPAQLIIILLGVLAVVLLHNNHSSGDKFTGAFLGLLWLWTGVAYHLAYFTGINKAAFGFGGLFVLQGLFFLYETFYRKTITFKFSGKVREDIGYFFVLFGLILYPISVFYLNGSIETTISLGLPCPTTILTLGFLMLSGRKIPKYMLIIPTVWAIIGTGAAISFSVYPDYLMLLAAIVADFYLIRRKKEEKMATI